MVKNKDSHPERKMEDGILAAAEQLFLKQGYTETSTTQIAKVAGCNQALVHYYFRTKEKLFRTVLGGKVKKVFNEIISLESGGNSFQEKLRNMIGLHYDTLRENAVMVPFLLTEFLRNPDIIQEVLSEVGSMPVETLRMLTTDLENEINKGNIRPIDPVDLILNVISLNIFLFAAKPMVLKAWNLSDKAAEELINHRKKEITDTILLSLRP